MELDRLEKRIRALQARKAARAATLERVQGIDPTEHEAAVYHAIHEDIALVDAHAGNGILTTTSAVEIRFGFVHVRLPPS